MHKSVHIVSGTLLAVAVGVSAAACGSSSNSAQGGGAPGAAGQGGRPGGGPGGGAFGRTTMTVELAPTSRAMVTEKITVVGNLIGAMTVDVVPKVSGRLETVNVRLGDPVSRGQLIAQVEDRELREQVRQAEASYEVSRATVRQRETDLKSADTNLERSRNLADRNLISRQTLDDAQARYDAAVAQVDLAKAQFAQAKARLDELQINLANSRILSPVNGFVGRRTLDPGAFVGPSAPVVSVVDIHFVRLVANLVEKDLRRVQVGMAAEVGVDAYPGETFAGRVARVAPVLDPSTRTAQMEVEIPNPGNRLKPGMYARVEFTVEERPNALVVPRNALVDIEGKRGVFVAAEKTARFRLVTTGLQNANVVEILSGVNDGDHVVTTGAGSLRDGDAILLPGAVPGGPGGAGRPGSGRPGGTGGPGQRRPGGQPPAGPGPTRQGT